MSAAFNSYVAVFWLLKPHAFIGMFPKALQKKARSRTREEKRHTLILYATLYPALFVWMVLSTWQAGVTGFWNLFWMAYAEMLLVSLGDLIFLDYLLLKKTGTRLHADGVKGDPFYEPKNELIKLGLPEHLILWPLVFCPVVGAMGAGVGMLLR
jgi:nitrate reductase NapE component